MVAATAESVIKMSFLTIDDVEQKLLNYLKMQNKSKKEHADRARVFDWLLVCC